MRRLPPLILALAAAVAAPACGGSEAATPLAVVQASVDRTAEAKTSRVAITVDTDVAAASGAARQASFAGEGLFDYEGERGVLTFDLSSLGVPGAGDGRAEVRMLGPDVYLRVPGLAEQAGGKEWLTFDLDAVGEQAGVDLEQLRQLQDQGDPTAALAHLRGVSGDVRKLGEEEVRGEETTHYAATVDLEKAAAAAPAEARPAIERVAEHLGTTTLPVEVWVDDEGRTRRTTQTVDLSAAKLPAGAAGATGTVRTTVELFDFGVAVDVQAPPADQVLDVTDLATRAGAGG